MKEVFRNFALAGASIVIFWGFVEGGLRIAGLEPRRTVDSEFDWARRGEFWSFKPGARWKTKIGNHPVAINAYGLRDREVGPRVAGSFRILVLGDSVTFGHGVPIEDSYVRQLEWFLAWREPRVEVLNAGIPGWSTRQQRIFYDEYAGELTPQLVLVGFVLNDFTEMHRGLIELGAQREAMLFRWVNWLSMRSAAFASAKGAYESIRSPQEREIRAVAELTFRADSPEVQRAMDVTIGELEELAARVRGRGEGFGLVVFPFRFQFLGDDFDVPQRRLERFAAENDLPFLDVLPALRRHDADEVLMDADHLTPLGHLVVAEEIARWLERESLLP